MQSIAVWIPKIQFWLVYSVMLAIRVEQNMTVI
jgi:hypothetical protein